MNKKTFQRLHSEQSGEVFIILLIVTLLIAGGIVACDPTVKERTARLELEAQRERTQEAVARADEARYRVKEKEVEGENEVRRAYAFSVRITSLVWATVQLGAPILAIGAVLGLGLCFLWLLTDYRSPLLNRDPRLRR
ncbi:MAG: hypothetical protein ABIH46_02095 [Chloroflexota bacterium]